MKCKDCKHLKRIEPPLRVGRDIYDTGKVHCDKYDMYFEYTSTRALNKLSCVREEQEHETRDDSSTVI